MVTGTKPKAGAVIVLGIDFGTTNSGIAFAHSDSPDQIKVVMNWGGSADSAKCPTLLRYDEEGQVSGWGYEAKKLADKLGWFKLLLLHPEEEAFEYLQGSAELRVARQRMREQGKKPDDLVTDYLTKLLTEAKKKMCSVLATRTIEDQRIRIVLTVPAMWPQYALKTMSVAATKAKHRAGLGSSTETDFVPEPEAAALATLKDKFPSGCKLLQRGDCFVVCDAGGGTVDLITYRVVSMRPFAIEEFVKGEGELCGAIQLDTRFRELLKSKVTAEVWEQISDSFWIFERQWEMSLKQEFTKSGGPYHINLGLSAANPKNPHAVTLSSAELQSVFDPVVNRVIALAHDQVGLACEQLKKIAPRAKGLPVKEYVVLVGGFSKCTHLRQRFEDWRKGLSKDIQPENILQGDGNDPWSAVSRGAVTFGFNQEKKFRQAVPGATTIDIKARKLQLSIGVLCTFDPFDDEVHQEKQRWSCPVQKRDIAIDAVSWFARAGETLPDGKPIPNTFTLTCETPSDLKKQIDVKLAYSNLADPPIWHDESVRNLCKITWHPKLDFESLPKPEDKPRAKARELVYDVQVVFDGALAKFSIMYNGKEVASTDFHVDFQGSGQEAQNEDVDDPMILC